jgi:hypothetical protein
LTGLGYSIIAFAILVGIGVVLIGTFAKSVAGCGTGYTYQANATTSFSNGKCCLTAGSDCVTGANATSPSTATTQLEAMGVYMGTGSGGLASWIPLIIIAVIGIWFLGMFMGRRQNSA